MTSVEHEATPEVLTETGHDVFVSYAREDQPFVRGLTDALAVRGKHAWVDWVDIPPTAEWMEEIRTAIDVSDTYIAVISPDSLASPVCAAELDGAVQGSKRIVPVVCRDVETEQVPESLAKLNWIVFTEDFDQGVEKLMDALDTDLEYVKAHTRLLVKAKEWETKGEDKALLVRGRDLGEAEAWLASAGTKSPPPTQLQTRFLLSSRKAATRRQRGTISAVTAMFLVAALLGVVAFDQRNAAVEQRDLARTQAAASASLSQLDHDPEVSLLLALEATKSGHTPLVEEALRRSILSSHLVRVLRGHTAEVDDLGFSPDGSRLITTSQDQTLRVWDVHSGRTLASTKVPGQSGASSIGIDPTGRYIAVGGYGSVTILEAATLHRYRTLPIKGYAYSVQFSSDGKRLAVAAGDGGISVWKMGSSQPAHRFKADSPAYFASFSPDGRSLATAMADGTARVFDLASEQQRLVLRGDTDLLYRTRYSPDGSLLLTASQDRTARVWDARTGELLRILPHVALLQDAAWAADGTAVVTVDAQGEGWVWNVDTGQLVTKLLGHRKWITYVAVSPDGRHIATGSADSTARVWRIGPATPQLTMDQGAPAMGATFNPDASRIATAGDNGRGTVWDASTGRRLSVFDQHARGAPTYSPDGRSIASIDASKNGTAVRVWDSASGRLELTIPFGTVCCLRNHEANPEFPFAVTFRPDGSQLAVALERATRLYDVRSGHVIATYESVPRLTNVPSGSIARMHGVAFSPDGTLLAVADGAAAVIWDPIRDEVVRTFIWHDAPVIDVRFSPDGRELLTSSEDGSAKLWDVRTGAQVTEFEGHQGPVITAAFSPDGRFVVTAGEDGTARVWTIAGTEIEQYQPDVTFVTGASFSPDGQSVLVSTAEGINFAPPGVPLPDHLTGAAKIYACEVCLSYEGLISFARQRVTRSLTPAERRRYLPSGGTTSASPSAGAAPQATPILGSFQVRIRDSDATSPKERSDVGNWFIHFFPDGEYDVWAGLFSTHGTYDIQRDHVSFRDDNCGRKALGTYTWNRSGERLTLTQVDDPCSQRTFVFGTRPFQKVG